MKELEYQHEEKMKKLEIREKRKKKSARAKNAKKKLGYTKCLSIFVFLVVVEVIVFAEFEMHRLKDLTALYVLIGATVTTGFAYFIGLLNKHAKENTKGGIVYETAMRESAEKPAGLADPDAEGTREL